MQPTPYLLEAGQVDQSEVKALEQRIDALEVEVRSLKLDLRAAQRVNAQAIARYLSPLYKALAPVFGEIADVADVEAPAVNGRAKAVWESWKSKLPGKRAEFIQALLDHGEMTGSQLRVATHTAAGSVAGIIHELKKLGLINKNGGKYSLKEL